MEAECYVERRPRAGFKLDWFGLRARANMPSRGPRWFTSRGANFVYVCLGGWCSVTVPWFWHRAAIEARGYDRGWNAGYEAGSKARRGDA